MRLLELQLRNFLSFGDDVQTVVLHGRGLVLVEGENGAGKSAILEALIWALFGKTIRGLTSDKVVNNTIGKNCCVALDMEIKGQPYRIERYRKHSTQGNKLRFFGGGYENTRPDSADTQGDICGLTGLTYDTFINSVVFGQGVAKRFTLMTDKEQKSVMDKLIGTEQLVVAHEAAKEAAATLSRRLEDLDLFDLQAEVSVTEDNLQSATSTYENWASTRSLRLSAIDNSISDEAKKIGNDVSKDIPLAVRAAEAAGLELSSATTKLGAAGQALETAKKNAKKALTEGGQCPACGSLVERAGLARHRAQLEAQVVGAEKAHQRALEANLNAQNMADQCCEWVDTLKDQKAAAQEAQRVIKKLNEDKAFVASETNPYGSRVAELTGSLKKLQRALGAAETEAANLRTEQTYLDFVLAMLSDKGTKEAPPLKGCLLDSVTPFLNETANKFSKFITGGDISIAFETQRELQNGELREEFSVAATNLYGADVYDGDSGGEKRKIDLCVALALQSLGASRHGESINVAFYDEIFESLDEDAIDKVMALLTEESKSKDSLFVVTHMASLKAEFPAKLSVVKQGGLSIIK